MLIPGASASQFHASSILHHHHSDDYSTRRFHPIGDHGASSPRNSEGHRPHLGFKAEESGAIRNQHGASKRQSHHQAAHHRSVSAAPTDGSNPQRQIMVALAERVHQLERGVGSPVIPLSIPTLPTIATSANVGKARIDKGSRSGLPTFGLAPGAFDGTTDDEEAYSSERPSHESPTVPVLVSLPHQPNSSDAGLRVESAGSTPRDSR